MPALVLAGVAVLAYLLLRPVPPPQPPAGFSLPTELAAVPVMAIPQDVPTATNYVGSQVCAKCHPEIAASYARHPMANDLTRVADASPIEQYHPSHSTFEEQGSSYRVEKRNGRVLHCEFLVDAQGETIYEQEIEVHYAVGSGAKARSYLIDRGGVLFQSPITWYIENQRWDLSPGYHKNPRQRFNRRVSDGCLQCHSGGVRPLGDGTSNRFHRDTFVELGIGCEKCHGPGQDHVTRHETWDFSIGDPPADDPTIVNPADLEPRLRDSVCYQCHMEGKRRILRRGKSFHDFRPGMATEAVWTVFVAATPFEADGTARFTSQVEQMRASACFRGTSGGLTCITCHDPHQSPEPHELAAFYRERCNACHAEQGCALPIAKREAPPALNSCIHCHMPMLGSSDIPHTSQSDHRLLRNPAAESPADRAAGQTEVWLIFDDSHQRMPEFEVRRARALALYEQAFEELDARLMQRAALELEALLAGENADDVRVLRSLGFLYGKFGKFSESERYLKHAVQIDPNDETALMNLGLLAFRRQDHATGLVCYERLLKLNPWDGPAHGPYAELLAATGNMEAAVQAARRGLELDPTLHPLRKALTQFYMRLGDEAGSREHQRLGAEIHTRLAPWDAKHQARLRQKMQDHSRAEK